ncbi:HET-domain-containing protein, partial [Hyaloscypha hepaticicola]
MRLLHSQTLKLEEFHDLTLKPYAILSHTWGEGEISFQEMQSGEGSKKAAYSKILGCCKAAAADGFDYVWIDTCCIDKTSSSELSEAINSMYKWYQEAEVCYVYLADVFQTEISTSNFAKSRWFTRGWTLQELIAPSSIIFFDAYWRDIGTKNSLLKPITEITGIHMDALRNARVSRFSVAQRMSWASRRETTREEDIAYCLLGIFSINMPLLYGEGEKAFLRLQEEIMKKSDDHSIFAWTLPRSEIFTYRYSEGFLAQTPLAFVNSSTIVRSKRKDSLPFTTTNRGIHLQLPL